MIKKLLVGMATMTLAGAVSAAPVTWTFGGSNLAGSFDFDADLGTFLSVSFSESNFGDNYDNATGTASSLTASSINYGDFTSLSFLAPLTNVGGLISFTGSTQCFSACGSGPNPYSFAGTVTAPVAAVPLPATMGLLGLGLAALAGLRRKTA